MLRFLFCSFALVLLYPTAIDLYLVGLPQIAADLHASEAQLHIAFSIYLAGMAATMLFAGKLADTIGRKPVAIAGAVIFSIASFTGGIAENAEFFLIARFVQGIGAGSCYVVAFAILRDVLDDKKRAKVLSMLNGITCIVPVLAPVLGHLIMTQYPWQSLFVTMTGMGVAVTALSLFVLKETFSKKIPSTNTSLVKGMPPQNSSKDSANDDQPVDDAWKVESFKTSFFVSRVVMTSLAVTAILTYVNVSPMLLMSELGLDRAGYSAVMAGTAFVSMLVSFSAPFALSIFKQRTLMAAAQLLLVTAASLVSLSFSYQLDHAVTFIGFGLVSAGFSLGFGVTMSQALSPYSKRAGVASSILGVAQVCTSAFYIWFMGVIGVSALGMLAFILAGGGVIGLALILWVRPSCTQNDYEEITRAS